MPHAPRADFRARYEPWAVVAGGRKGWARPMAERLAALEPHVALVARRRRWRRWPPDDRRSRYRFRALALDLAHADAAAEGTDLFNLGDVLRRLGRIAEARRLIAQSLILFEPLGDVYNIGNCHEFLGRVETDADDIPAAIAHYREALRRFAQVRSPDAEVVRAALRELGVEPRLARAPRD